MLVGARRHHRGALGRRGLARLAVLDHRPPVALRRRADLPRSPGAVPARRGVGRHGGVAAALHRHRRPRGRGGDPAPAMAPRGGRGCHDVLARRHRVRPGVTPAAPRRALGRRVRDEPDPRAPGDGDPPAAALRRPGARRRGGGGIPAAPVAAGERRRAHRGDDARGGLELHGAGLGWLLGLGPRREHLPRRVAGCARRAALAGPRPPTGRRGAERSGAAGHGVHAGAVAARARRRRGGPLGTHPIGPRLRRAARRRLVAGGAGGDDRGRGGLGGVAVPPGVVVVEHVGSPSHRGRRWPGDARRRADRFAGSGRDRRRRRA